MISFCFLKTLMLIWHDLIVLIEFSWINIFFNKFETPSKSSFELWIFQEVFENIVVVIF